MIRVPLWKTLFLPAGRYFTISVWVAVTFIALFPGAHPPVATFNWVDKIEHFIAFSTLAFLFCLFWETSRVRLFLLLLAYGCGIELFQLFIPDHVASLLDILADFFGIVSGLGGIFLLERIIDDRQDEADRLSVR